LQIEEKTLVAAFVPQTARSRNSTLPMDCFSASRMPEKLPFPLLCGILHAAGALSAKQPIVDLQHATPNAHW
jgi:hypothetical protein